MSGAQLPPVVRVDAELRALLAGQPLRDWRVRISPRRLRLLTAMADSAQVVAVGMLVLQLLPPLAETLGTTRGFWLAMVAAALTVSIRRGLRLPQRQGAEPTASVATRAAMAVLLSLGTIAACAALLRPALSGGSAVGVWLLAWAIISAVGAIGLRYGADWLAEHVAGAAPGIAVVGAAPEATPLADALGALPRSAWHLAGQFRDDVAADLDRVAELVARNEVEVVALAIPPHHGERIQAVCERLADKPVRICLGLEAGLRSALPADAMAAGGFPLLDLVAETQGGWRGLAKRAADVVLASLALLVLGPALLGVGIALRLESPGPALFKQWRFGLGSRPIRVFKFRTMRADKGDATGAQRTLARDPRVTPLGRILRRTSIDELPQLLNVLRGEMSLVGPRPHPMHMKVEENYYFEAVEKYRIRHRVKPGITGWAQVNGSRGEVDTLAKARRRVELDLWYIRNWSLALDARIIWRTVMGGFRTGGVD